MSIFELSNSVGTVLQDPDGQFIGLTVGEDIAFKLENDCISRRNERKSKIVSEIVGIDTLFKFLKFIVYQGDKNNVLH